MSRARLVEWKRLRESSRGYWETEPVARVGGKWSVVIKWVLAASGQGVVKVSVGR